MRAEVCMFGKLDLLAQLSIGTKTPITGPTIAGVTEIRMGWNPDGYAYVPLPCIAAVTIPPDREAVIDHVGVFGNLEFLALIAVLLKSTVAFPTK
jgi:hypothetical protein